MAKAGPKGELIATPSIWSKIFPSKKKCVCYVTKQNNLVNSFFENLRAFLFSKINLTAISIVSLSGVYIHSQDFYRTAIILYH